MTDQNAIFIGGPKDGTLFAAPDSALVEVPMDDLVHRYIRTDATRDHDGQTYPVYNYDGEVRPQMRRETHDQR